EQLESAGVRIVKGGGHIVDFEREVMRAFAMLGEECAELGTLVERLQQLDGCGPFSEKRDSQVSKSLFAAEFESEGCLKVRSGLVNRSDGPTEMVDHRHLSRAPPPPLRGSSLTSRDGHADSMPHGRGNPFPFLPGHPLSRVVSTVPRKRRTATNRSKLPI